MGSKGFASSHSQKSHVSTPYLAIYQVFLTVRADPGLFERLFESLFYSQFSGVFDEDIDVGGFWNNARFPSPGVQLHLVVAGFGSSFQTRHRHPM